MLSKIKFKIVLLINKIYLFFNKNITVGDFTYGIPKIYFDKATFGKTKITKLTIGKFCSIAPFRVKVLLGGEHDIFRTSTYPLGFIFNDEKSSKGLQKSKGDVYIGNDVWIGIDATIMSGVKIGDGAVIGTNSVVRKNVPPYAIVMGNPASIVGFRFSEEKIKKFLKIKWWDWNINEIKKATPLISSNKYEEFFEYCRKKNIDI
jgi:virginiamycin A acetyltransferase